MRDRTFLRKRFDQLLHRNKRVVQRSMRSPAEAATKLGGPINRRGPSAGLPGGGRMGKNTGMRLAEFIEREMEAILSDWEAFAATLLPAASEMNAPTLRDHAQQILEAIAADLATSQSREEQSEKSKGRAARIDGASETAAQTHAVLRAHSGFDVNQLVAEYRALRASVLRLWMDPAPLDDVGVEDMIRFNEAIDQAITESVGHFHQAVETYRNLLLGMLGHDMRDPLNAILITASVLARLDAGPDVADAARRLLRSGASMRGLLDDLMDFNRTHLGLGLRVHRVEMDLAEACHEELDQYRASYPERRFDMSATGDLRGQWDGPRLRQVLRNLISNAIRYGAPGEPIRVDVRGDAFEVHVEVGNGGRIDPSTIQTLFDPLRRGRPESAAGEARDGLGLGLFIVREIVEAHDGKVAAGCEGDWTTFSVCLPRRATA